MEKIVGIVATIDIVLAPLALCPGTTSHRIQTVLSESLLVVQYVVPYDNAADVSAIIACTEFLTADGSRYRVKEVGGCSLCTVERERCVISQFWYKGDSSLSCCQQSVVSRLIILSTGDILCWRGNVHAIEVVVELARILRIPYRCIGWRIDDSCYYATSVRTGTRNDTCTLVGIIRISDTGIESQPLTYIVLYRCTEVVALIA